MPSASTRKAKSIPGRISNRRNSIVPPASTVGAIEATIANMAIAANGETTSRSFSRLFRRRIARAARPATATASSGRIDITGSKPLSFHHGHVVDLEGGLVPHKGDQDTEGDCNLRRGDCDDEDREDLPAEIIVVMPESDEVDVDRVEQKFQRHEHHQNIAPEQYARCSDHEQDHSEHNKPPERNHHSCSFRASTMAPTRAAKRITEAASNGRR
ncbi:hypothetical protein RHECNPAF_35000124 [Rhizobium etli CNPAF512]|nr:hypothetical protein RHECNPAF_35000124 [Rhizobium etli CNPAF512]